MAERDEGAASTEPDSLLVWCLATFHTTLFVLVPLTLLHWAGALGDLLGGLSTTVGLALYGLLWATTWATNRRLLVTTPFAWTERWALSKASVKWGGVTGSCFFLELVAVVVGQAAVAGELGVPSAASVLPILFVLALGTLVAFVVGALVGVGQVVLDLTALRVVEVVSARN
ncbi:hypothetical protein SAMN04487950_3091 [Halogranum rubrum]|uniref:DUF7965 domain-containing protein n=1 Tax=Halogranum rubrum TaxID=553466 RepID=A0A1I4GA18_9EURY|nr:hypothetical protein [Halogranum rubrum]SFL25946.1 hypothetical protein SAMN04487950_3091 [Halogranum rubrum]